MGQTLTASVASVEDNGYILDLAVEGVTAFISFSDGKKANRGRFYICASHNEL